MCAAKHYETKSIPYFSKWIFKFLKRNKIIWPTIVNSTILKLSELLLQGCNSDFPVPDKLIWSATLKPQIGAKAPFVPLSSSEKVLDPVSGPSQTILVTNMRRTPNLSRPYRPNHSDFLHVLTSRVRFQTSVISQVWDLVICVCATTSSRSKITGKIDV